MITANAHPRSFEPTEVFFSRSAIVSPVDEGKDLLSWLRRPETQLALFSSYPDLAAKVYGLVNVSAEALKNERSLWTKLIGLKMRSEYSTVPLGAFCIIGAHKRAKNLADEEPKIKSLNLSVVSTQKQKMHPAQQKIKINPYTFDGGKELCYLASEIVGDKTTCLWRTFPNTDPLISKFLKYLSLQRTICDCENWFHQRGIAKNEARKMMSLLIEKQLVFEVARSSRFSPPRILEHQNLSCFEDLKWSERFEQDLTVLSTPEITKIALSGSQIKQIEEASRLLIALSLFSHPQSPDVEALREKIRETYDTRSVPILNLINPYKGFSPPEKNQTSRARLPDLIRKKLANAETTPGPLQVTAQDLAELERLTQDSNRALGFSASFLIEKGTSDEAVTPWIRKVFSGIGVRPISRFFHFLPGNLTTESFLSEAPEGVIIAEIGTRPPDKRGNLFDTRGGEGYILDTSESAVAGPRRIPMESLWIGVANDLIYLWSEAHKKYVIPIQSNAANWALDPNPLSFILAACASQFVVRDIDFQWMDLTSQRRLPRVMYEGVVVSPETWRISSPQFLKSWHEGAAAAAQYIRNQIPEVDILKTNLNDREIFVDLKQPESLSILTSLFKNSEDFTLKEVPEIKVIQSFGDRRLRSEFIQPFLARDLAPLELNLRPVTEIERPYPNILSYEIDASIRGQNSLLKDLVKLTRREKIPFFYLRLFSHQQMCRVRFLLGKGRRKYNFEKKMDDFLSKKRSLLNGFARNEYFAEKDVYDSDIALQFYHEFSALDSSAAIEAIEVASKTDDPILEILIAAWTSIITLYPAPGELRRRRIKHPLLDKNEREKFLKAKSLTAGSFTNEKKSSILKIYSRRTQLAKQRGLDVLWAKMSPKQQSRLVQRMIHLTLNRLQPEVLGKYESRFFEQKYSWAHRLEDK